MKGESDKIFIQMQKEAVMKTCDEMNILHPQPKAIKLNQAIRDKKLERLDKGLSPELTLANIIAISKELDK